MKKIGLICTMLVMLLLYGCAADSEPSDQTSLDDSISYSYASVTYTNVNETDILYETGDSFEDFAILHRLVMEKEFSAAESSAYQNLFDVIDILVSSTYLTYSVSSTYSSSDFNDLCETNSITITALDIITFNAYKSLLAELKEANNQQYLSLTKQQYIEERLNRNLTSAEVAALNILQDHYRTLALHYSTPPLIEMTFEDLLLAFKDHLSFEPIANDLDQIRVAYDIIQSLKTT